MKRIVILTTFVFCAFFFCVAQQAISLSDLTGTEWQRDDGFHCRFTSTEMVWIKLSNDSVVYSNPWPYYISNEDLPYTHIPFDETGKLFDHDKVGKGLIGNYLITYNPPCDDASSDSVTYLSQDFLYLYSAPYYSVFNGTKVYETKGVTMTYKRVNDVVNRATVEVCNWVYQMQTKHGATVYDYKNNRYVHLNGPNGGYDVWIPYMAGTFDKSKLQPQPKSVFYKNNQGVCLSNIFANSELNQMYQRARDLGVPYYSCASLLAKNDKLINMIFDGICAMANGYLYSSSPTDAKRYAEKLYDAFLHFKTDCATPEDLTLLCGGCDMPRYNK